MADPVEAHCPTCDGGRTCDVHGAVEKKWDWESRNGDAMNGGDRYSLLECRGCHTVFYERVSWDCESINQWYGPDGTTKSEYVRTKITYPLPATNGKPLWFTMISIIDTHLYSVLLETYSAYSSSLFILATIGLRTILDRAIEVLEIDPAKSFDEKLKSLKDKGWIGNTDEKILGVVIDAGSAAAHRGWSPDPGEMAELLSVTELFLQKAFVAGDQVLEIKASIPPRAAKQKIR